MPKITFKVNFYGGKGTAVFDGPNIPSHKTIDSDDADWEFSADQSAGAKIVAVGGTVPAGDGLVDGKITVEVYQGSVLLSSAAANTYVAKKSDDVLDYTFNSFITYAVI